jgi:hypothetical protein
MMGSAIAGSGMSMAEYTDAMRQVSDYIPAEDRAEFDQFLLLLQSCS